MRYIESNHNNGGATGGLGFCGALQVAFIVLKLLGKITWSWGWVLAPTWMPLVIVGLIYIIAITVTFLKYR